MPVFHGAQQELAVEPAAAVRIGDHLCDDIRGVQRARIGGILVRTGKFRSKDESDEGMHPVHVVDDFVAAVSVVLRG